MNPKDNPLWPYFENFCTMRGISLADQEDWGPWWDSFVAGSIAQLTIIHNTVRGV